MGQGVYCESVSQVEALIWSLRGIVLQSAPLTHPSNAVFSSLAAPVPKSQEGLGKTAGEGRCVACGQLTPVIPANVILEQPPSCRPTGNGEPT